MSWSIIIIIFSTRESLTSANQHTKNFPTNTIIVTHYCHILELHSSEFLFRIILTSTFIVLMMDQHIFKLQIVIANRFTTTKVTQMLKDVKIFLNLLINLPYSTIACLGKKGKLRLENNKILPYTKRTKFFLLF